MIETFQLTGSLPDGITNPAPTIDCYFPHWSERNGTGLIIFPGGGYGMLAAHEGESYAEYFVQSGICCFVVSYRLGSQGFRHPAMLEDALAAINTVREECAAGGDHWGIDLGKIGVMGSSAGGHLAAHALTAYDRYDGDFSLRPSFGILCYPVIAMSGTHCHTGSRANLLGTDLSEERITAVSPERLVTPQTPPCFLWHTCEDAAVPVENSLIFASALRANDVPFELHIYPQGRHGLGLNTELPWARDCVRWIKETVG